MQSIVLWGRRYNLMPTPRLQAVEARVSHCHVEKSIRRVQLGISSEVRHIEFEEQQPGGGWPNDDCADWVSQKGGNATSWANNLNRAKPGSFRYLWNTWRNFAARQGLQCCPDVRLRSDISVMGQ